MVRFREREKRTQHILLMQTTWLERLVWDSSRSTNLALLRVDALVQPDAFHPRRLDELGRVHGCTLTLTLSPTSRACSH